MAIYKIPNNRREAYEQGAYDGEATFLDTVRRGHIAELERAFIEEDMAVHITDALSALANTPNSIFKQGIDDDLLNSYEEGFFDGFMEEAQRYFTHHRNPVRRSGHVLARAWQGSKASYVSPRGDYGRVPHSELAISTRTAGKRVVQYALFTRNGVVNWAQVRLNDGTILDGLTGEVLPHEVRQHSNPLTPSERRRISKEAAAHDRDSAEHRTPYLKAFDKGTAAGMREAIAMTRANPVSPLGYSDGRRDRLAGRGARSSNGNYLDGYYGIRRR